MKVSIAKRAYPMNVTGIMRNGMLLKAYSKFLKRKVADELLDYVFCTVVQKKSPDFMYWNFIHDAAPKQINLGSQGDNLRDPIEQAMNAPDRVDTKLLKETLAKVYTRVVKMLDSNFELEFSKSPELEEFALKRTKLTPRIAAQKLEISEPRYLPSMRTLVLHLSFGRGSEAESLVMALLTKKKGKKPTRKALAKHMKDLEKAL